MCELRAAQCSRILRALRSEAIHTGDLSIRYGWLHLTHEILRLYSKMYSAGWVRLIVSYLAMLLVQFLFTTSVLTVVFIGYVRGALA